ncbi:MAG: hypothetical protein M3Y87_22255 [Myxococcota bacterium]|nr:hypothetical protein [Myxococcota bacterium]
MIDPFFFRAGAISLSGPLRTSADDEGFHLGFAGTGYGGGGTCGATEVHRTCQWHLAP